MGKLNERQRRFADEYIKEPNATQAMIKAGYSDKYAHTNGTKLLQNTRIKRYMDERLDKLKKHSIAEQDEILQTLTAIMRGEKTGKTKIGLGQGAEDITDIAPSVAEITRAADQLGRRYGMWTDNLKVEDVTPKFIEDIPDDD